MKRLLRFQRYVPYVLQPPRYDANSIHIQNTHQNALIAMCVQTKKEKGNIQKLQRTPHGS